MHDVQNIWYMVSKDKEHTHCSVHFVYLVDGGFHLKLKPKTLPSIYLYLPLSFVLIPSLSSTAYS